MKQTLRKAPKLLGIATALLLVSTIGESRWATPEACSGLVEPSSLIESITVPSAPQPLRSAPQVLADTTLLSIVDLTRPEAVSAAAKQAAYEYDINILDIYAQRLPKFQDTHAPADPEYQARIAAELKQRTVYILNTAEPLRGIDDVFMGGARLVLSKGAGKPLPFEIDLQMTRPNSEEPAAEVGRLSADGSESGSAPKIRRTDSRSYAGN